MHERDDARIASCDSLAHLFDVESLAVFGSHFDDTATLAQDVVLHAFSEDAVDPDHDAITLFDEVYETGLHAGTSRPGDR